jgi:hypothetical protein
LGTSGTPRCLEGGNIYGFMMVYIQTSAIFLRYIFVGTLCALEIVHPSDVFCKLCCAIQSVQMVGEWLRQGCSNGTCSSVESCDSDCGLQVRVVNRTVVIA